MTTSLFQRSAGPILVPDISIPWASGAVFNPGVWFENGITHMLFRAIPTGYTRFDPVDPTSKVQLTGFDNYVSSIGYASSRDGVHFDWRPEPFLTPGSGQDRFGVEDPRISKIDDTFLITYTALDSPAYEVPTKILIALATTEDFLTVKKLGNIGPPVPSKDTVIFPRRIGGRIAMLHRIVPDIQLIYFDDLEQLYHPPERVWKEHLSALEDCVVMRPQQDWESKKIGAGPTPIETDEGWLIIYHAVDDQHVYRVGLALLDLDDPKKVIARSVGPVMSPETDYERVGDVNNVVFPEGATLVNGVLHIYYGAADLVIGHASAPLSFVLDHLRHQPN